MAQPVVLPEQEPLLRAIAQPTQPSHIPGTAEAMRKPEDAEESLAQPLVGAVAPCWQLTQKVLKVEIKQQE